MLSYCRAAADGEAQNSDAAAKLQKSSTESQACLVM